MTVFSSVYISALKHTELIDLLTVVCHCADIHHKATVGLLWDVMHKDICTGRGFLIVFYGDLKWVLSKCIAMLEQAGHRWTDERMWFFLRHQYQRNFSSCRKQKVQLYYFKLSLPLNVAVFFLSISILCSSPWRDFIVRNNTAKSLSAPAFSHPAPSNSSDTFSHSPSSLRRSPFSVHLHLSHSVCHPTTTAAPSHSTAASLAVWSPATVDPHWANLMWSPCPSF